MPHPSKKRETFIPNDLKVCILYDPKDGRIAHHHMVGTFPGGNRVDESEVERRARARAEKFGTKTANLKALHVSAKDCVPSSKYKVDVHSMKLVELPRPRRVRKQP
jgi:hypothetical protein